MTAIRYGSFNRPLDFINERDIGQNFGLSHNSWPLKEGEPFSILAVRKLLSDDVAYRYELQLMDYEYTKAKCLECGGRVYVRKQDRKLVCEYEGEIQDTRCWGG